MSSKFVEFLSLLCKEQKHSACERCWLGLGFQFNCDCICHKKNVDVAGGFRGPDSATSGSHIMEVTSASD